MTQTIAVVWVLAVLAAGGTPPEAPSSVDLLFSQIQYSIGQQDWRTVTAHARAILAEQPDRWDMHRLAGESLMRLGRPAEALAHYGEWARLQPEDAEAASAVQQATDRQRAIDDRLEARERERAAARRTITKPSLAQAARERGKERASVPAEASGPTHGLEGMRDRAESILRPAMVATTADARSLVAARRRYAETCEGKSTVSRASDGLREGRARTVRGRIGFGREGTGRSWSDWTWVEERRVPATELRSAECEALAAEVDRRADAVAESLGRTETGLTQPPAVYRGIREEVFDRLATELW